MQARALVPVTVSDHMRLLYAPVKELILCIIFFVCFGAQSGCIAGWSPKNAGRPALPEHLLWGACRTRFRRRSSIRDTQASYLNSSIGEWAPENRLHSLTTNRW